MSFKIAYCAGHYLGTPGKRVPKYLDPNQTREWVLNDRVADYFNEAAKLYEGVELLRTDDPTGAKSISIKDRTKKANNWGADLYVDMHHNAGINGGTGGGVVAISKKNDAVGAKYRDAIYQAVIAAGHLRGNRSNPTYAKNYSTMVNSKAPGLIIEYGFMDSRTDYPIISTEEYAKAVGYATMEGIAKIAGLKKKGEAPEIKRLEVDGKWGRDTTTRLQEIFGTPVDGEVSNQWASYEKENPGLRPNSWEWVKKPNGKGSSLIKAMQKWAGMSDKNCDGEIGPKTIKAFQKKLGTKQDGYVSNPSNMVKALQKWANKQ